MELNYFVRLWLRIKRMSVRLVKWWMVLLSCRVCSVIAAVHLTPLPEFLFL